MPSRPLLWRADRHAADPPTIPARRRSPSPGRRTTGPGHRPPGPDLPVGGATGHISLDRVRAALGTMTGPGPARQAPSRGATWDGLVAGTPARRRAGRPVRGGRARPGWCSPCGPTSCAPTGRGGLSRGAARGRRGRGRGRPPRGLRGGRPRPGVGHGGRAADRHAHRVVQHGDDPGGGHPRPAARSWSPAPPRWTGSSTWPWPTGGRRRLPRGVVVGARARPGAGRFPEGEFPVWFFEVAGETIWGATARTLIELLCLVLGVAVPVVGPADSADRPSGRDGPGPRRGTVPPSVPGGIVGAVGRRSVGAAADRRSSRTATRVRRTSTWLS